MNRSAQACAMRRSWVMALVGAALTIAATEVASAQAILKSNTLVAKGQPDECFVAIGSTNDLFPAGPTCPKGQKPKVNQGYVWGMTETGSNVWFGTVANELCLVEANLEQTQAYQNPSWVCEFASRTASPAGSDWRPPKIFQYNVVSKKTTDYSSSAGSDLANTLGIRSAGSNSSIVFLAGPSLAGFPGVSQGIYLFAFTPTGTFLGSTYMTTYSDIRHWVVFNGDLYFGVQNAADQTGRIVHWIGTTSDPFQFEEVGVTDSEVASLAVLGNQIYATTWGGFNDGISNAATPSGLWVSPPTPVAGDVTTCSSAVDTTRCWTELWNVYNYEVDPVTGVTIVGGAMAAYNNQIYWGTMQIPLSGVLAHDIVYPNDTNSQQTTIMNTTRATAIFRYNPANQTTQLLYGNTTLPVFDGTTSTWSNVPNATGQAALYGTAGFGNPFNTYLWSAAVFGTRLFMGTFDWSYIEAEGLAAQYGLSANATTVLTALGGKIGGFGADLWRFDSSTVAAKAENTTGLGNYLNYGVRNLIADSCNLYAGMANPMNLMTAKGQADGGWEFRILNTGARCTQ